MTKRTAVYSAIFGAYDNPPPVSHIDPAISYFLFSDGTAGSPPHPWELRPLAAIFADPQRDARRVKVLPHLFLPEGYDVSVWLDANCHIKDLTADAIWTIIGDSTLAVPEHLERRCVFEEAQALISLGYFDSPARIARQMTSYEIAGLPRQVGLHHTNFLVRRHAEQDCIRFCNEWWEEICRHSKRDQLSFDFVRWKLGHSGVRTISMPYADNPLFHSLGIHRSPRRVTSEHLTASVLRNALPHKFLAVAYRSHYDAWPADFLRHLRRLNEIAAESGQPLEGNLCYFHNEENFLHSPPDPRRGERRETFLRALAGRRSVFEIGFNAGHSALLALTHSAAAVTAIDIADHAYTEAAAAYLCEAFAGRFRFFRLDSLNLPMFARDLDLGAHDLIHIDGGHSAEVFASDAAAAVTYSKPGTLLLIDDIYVPCIRHMTRRLVSDNLLAPYGDLETIESGAYVVLEMARCSGAISHVATLNRLLESVGEPLRASEEANSPFMAHLISDLLDLGSSDPPANEQAAPFENTSDSTLTLPLDQEIMDEIGRIGHHPFILVRSTDGTSSARFLICDTQNEAADFAKELAKNPALSGSKLLLGIERALHHEIGEAAELFFSWIHETNGAQEERVYLGLAPGTRLPAYYNYPIFEVAPGANFGNASQRLRQSMELLNAYEGADGNDRCRIAIVEALSLAAGRHLGIRHQFADAAKVIARAFRIHPASRHLRVASNALDLRSRSKLAPYK